MWSLSTLRLLNPSTASGAGRPCSLSPLLPAPRVRSNCTFLVLTPSPLLSAAPPHCAGATRSSTAASAAPPPPSTPSARSTWCTRQAAGAGPVSGAACRPVPTLALCARCSPEPLSHCRPGPLLHADLAVLRSRSVYFPINETFDQNPIIPTPQDADLVVLEFSANDKRDAPYTDPERKGYEQLIRKLLQLPGRRGGAAGEGCAAWRMPLRCCRRAARARRRGAEARLLPLLCAAAAAGRPSSSCTTTPGGTRWGTASPTAACFTSPPARRSWACLPT